jgi:UPF0755 protein
MLKKIAGFIFLLGLVVALWLGFELKTSVVNVDKIVTIRLRSNWSMDSLANVLENEAGLENKEGFKTWATRLKYTEVKPCFLDVLPGDDLWSIIKRLKSLRKQVLMVVINPEFDMDKLIKAVSGKIQVDSAELAAALSSDSIMGEYGLNKYNWQVLFIPNSYEFYVSTDLQGFFAKMKKEQDLFWTKERLALAEGLGYTKMEVVNIASIVTKESHMKNEQTDIAGVYINRLKKGMKLQADPTVNFAKGKGGRVYYKDLNIQSAYNTYQNVGLPPGPICIPSPSSIDAVLNYQGHKYLFFCAKEDFSGYHNFAETYSQHQANAARWSAALDKEKQDKAELN